jgi:hypothetical protein
MNDVAGTAKSTFADAYRLQGTADPPRSDSSRHGHRDLADGAVGELADGGAEVVEVVHAGRIVLEFPGQLR